MSEYLLKVVSFAGIVSGLLHALVTGASSIFESILFGISSGSVIGFLYDRLLWRYNPLEPMPRLGKMYHCIISYKHGEGGSKETMVIIKQRLSGVSLRFDTDEIHSRSTSGLLVKEGDDFVLEYLFVTEPKAAVMDCNPKKDGAAKLRIVSESRMQLVRRLTGYYWTTGDTKGDMELELVKDS